MNPWYSVRWHHIINYWMPAWLHNEFVTCFHHVIDKLRSWWWIIWSILLPSTLHSVISTSTSNKWVPMLQPVQAKTVSLSEISPINPNPSPAFQHQSFCWAPLYVGFYCFLVPSGPLLAVPKVCLSSSDSFFAFRASPTWWIARSISCSISGTSK